MERIEYRGVVDKSDWPRGPWDDEPDKVQWRDEASGFACLIVRSHLGTLCGYVGVPAGHPWHGLYCERVRMPGASSARYDDAGDPRAHGGLTFAGACQHGADPARGICHVPGPGDPDDLWWLGFDCAHLYDLVPALGRFHLPDPSVIYRDLDFVAGAVAALAEDAAKAARAPEVAPPVPSGA